MNNYDNLLRKKEQDIITDASNSDKHWEQLLISLDAPSTQDNVPKPKGKLLKFGKYVLGVAVLSIITFFAVKVFKKSKTHSGDITIASTKVKPPIPTLDVPYENFKLDVIKGDTIVTKNGSIIIFPKNAVIDERGNVVKDVVDVKAREFNDPIDFAFSGIPMTYDSAGKVYDFLSSGMMEINTYLNNKKLFVNPNAKPEIILTSTSTELNSNLYQLNETTGQWSNKGKDEVVVLNEEKSKNALVSNDLTTVKEKTVIVNSTNNEQSSGGYYSKPNNFDLPIMPIPPVKASGKNPVIVIEIDPESFKELKLYDNLEFEIIGGDKWNEADSKIEWNDVKLERVTDGKLYRVTFKKGARTLSYLANPVLQGFDYDHAVSKYTTLLDSYNQQLKNYDRTMPIADSVKYKQASLNNNNNVSNQNVKTEQLDVTKIQEKQLYNKIIKVRNEAIEKRNLAIAANNKRVLELERKNKLYIDSIININNAIAEKQKIEIKKMKRIQDSIADVYSSKLDVNQLQANMVRRFTIDGFGIWNCDTPIENNALNFKVNYVNADNKYFEIGVCYSLTKARNTIIQSFGNKVQYIANSTNLLFGFNRGKIFYQTIKNTDNLKQGTNQSFDLQMIELNTTATSFYKAKKQLIDKLNNS